MKVFISVDIEGVAGVTHAMQGQPGNPEYETARRLMVRECNAAVEGALAAGATDIVVNDSHGEMRNLLASEIHPAAQLITGRPRPLLMGDGADSDCDAGFFVGYHASAGMRGAVLDHTFASGIVYEVRLNGVVQSEGSLNAMLCGSFGFPVVLFTGDQASVDEMKSFVPEIEAVSVKSSYSKMACRSMHPSAACAAITEAARRALDRRTGIPLLRPTSTLEIELDTMTVTMADLCECIPTVRRIGRRTISIGGSDFRQLYQLLMLLIMINKYNIGA